MEYFKKLLALLEIEWQYDKTNYSLLIESSSVIQRRADGLSWYPVAIRDTEMTRGDYLSVELERTTHQDISHQFRFGASVALFSNHDPKQDRAEGIITYQGANKMKITLRTDELPEWTKKGKLGVDLLFDDNSFNEMRQALKQAAVFAEKEKPENARLINVLTNESKTSTTENAVDYKNELLNASQQLAVRNIINASELAIVHGPPGTGKTTTLVHAIKAILDNEKQVLVTAPSNTAVDLLTEKLSDAGINVLRIGNPVRVSEALMGLTLDGKMSAHAGNRDLKKLKKQASEYLNLAHKYKRHFGKAEREQRKALFDEAHRIMKDVEKTEQYIIDDLISSARVITSTLVGANHYTIRQLRFQTVVIDEAGQSIEPACWIPIIKGKKLVMAGDHNQLPPTVKSDEAAREGLQISLLEKCITRFPGAVNFLDVQYRMNEKIMKYPSLVFYGDNLKAHDSVARHSIFANDRPFTFIDTSGCGFEESAEGTSIVNPEEASFLVRHLVSLVESLKDLHGHNDFPSVAVIAPYKQQVQLLANEIKDHPSLAFISGKISVNTIDSFQGQERDVVYIGLTRSNADNRIGFLSEIRRINVAMTRARKKLVVIGDGATLTALPFYRRLIDFAGENDAWQSAWEYL